MPFLIFMKINKHIFYKKSLSNNKFENNNNILVLPYNIDLAKIQPVLRFLKVHFVFLFENTLKNNLIKNSPKNQNSCIYKMPCNNCGSFYINQTCKSLKTRIK